MTESFAIHGHDDRISARAAPGFDTDLDLDRLDVITSDEALALIDWYDTAHGDGEGDLTPFVGFLIENGPGSLKLYRGYAQALDEHGKLPQLAVALLFLHYYMARGNERGVLYEVVAARQWGATKREVLETIRLTFVESGPLGGNAAAASRNYLRDWDPAEVRRVLNPWPAHWRTALVDTATIPPSSPTARLLGDRAPRVLAALQSRVREARGDTELPSIMLVLYDLHGAVTAGRARDAAHATRLALEAGLTSDEVLEVIGFGALYASVAQLDEIAQAVDPVLAAADRL